MVCNFEICHAQRYLILYSINYMTISQHQIDNVLTVSIYHPFVLLSFCFTTPNPNKALILTLALTFKRNLTFFLIRPCPVIPHDSIDQSWANVC